MKFTSFKSKLIFSVSFAAAVVFGTIMIYSINVNKTRSIENAESEMILLAEKYALRIEAEIEIAMDASNTIASTFVSFKKNNTNINRNDINELLKQVLNDNPTFLATYTLWEPDAFDEKDNNFINDKGHDKSGRFIPYWTKNKNDNFVLEPLVDYMTEGPGNYFQIPKKTKQEAILEPYIYPVQGKNVLITSLVSPVLLNNEFKAIAGIDIAIDFLQNYAENAKKEIYSGNSNISIIANNGTYAANTANNKLIGKNIKDIFDDAAKQVTQIKRGKLFKLYNKNNLIIHVPISIGKTETPWQVRISISEKIILSEANTQMWTLIIGGFILLIMGIFSIYLLIDKLTRPLITLVKNTKQISEGNLTIKIKSNQKDEIGELANSFNTMVERLKNIIITIKENINNVKNGSQQISESSQQIAQGANEQAASAEEISSSIEEMVAAINQNTDNAQKADKIAVKAKEGIIEGHLATNNTLETMKTISEKITIINDIAEKTDLLAINAAIEASRAGQYGKSFAVVASEIRKLAENSQKASIEIITLVNSSVKIAEKSGNILTKIVPDVQNTAILIQEISSASNEQNVNANQINKAIQEFNSIVQYNASTAEELSSGSERLASQSVTLEDAINFFNIESDLNDFSEVQSEIMSHISETFKKVKNKKLKDFEITVKPKETNNEKKLTEEKKDEAKKEFTGININLENYKDKPDTEYEKF